MKKWILLLMLLGWSTCALGKEQVIFWTDDSSLLDVKIMLDGHDEGEILR